MIARSTYLTLGIIAGLAGQTMASGTSDSFFLRETANRSVMLRHAERIPGGIEQVTPSMDLPPRRTITICRTPQWSPVTSACHQEAAAKSPNIIKSRAGERLVVPNVSLPKVLSSRSNIRGSRTASSVDTSDVDTTGGRGNRVWLDIDPCEGNEVKYYQDGTGNQLKVTVRGAANTVSVRQTGTGNEIRIDQQTLTDSDPAVKRGSRIQKAVEKSAKSIDRTSNAAVKRDSTESINRTANAARYDTVTAAVGINSNIQQSNCNEGNEPK